METYCVLDFTFYNERIGSNYILVPIK